jgi:hypothetical protein|nr:MAG TPA: duffy receptor-like protein [Caudoviricetes sp.]
MEGFIIGFLLLGIGFNVLVWYDFYCGIWNSKYGGNDGLGLDY